MKQLFTGIAILLVLAALCFAAGRICISITDSTFALAQQALESTGDERLYAIRRASSLWEKSTPWLLAMQYHDQVEDVHLELEALEQCALKGLDTEFSSRTAELRILLE
ncbi:MAG: DUF4363 family protein, partial [Oscillospiraceae bacterium]|nr:DUF4363 family protein [Oscillospiraceae bacterium]